MNTATASGIASRTWRAPWTSISSTTGAPARTRRSSSERSVPYRLPEYVACSTKSPAPTCSLELLGRQEVVVDAVVLARPRLARRGRDRQLELGDALEQTSDQRALPHPGGPGDHEDHGHGVGSVAAQRRRMSATSSRRWRSESPPIVLLGEILHCDRILLTFTRPYFGTASRRSNTFAVSR